MMTDDEIHDTCGFAAVCLRLHLDLGRRPTDVECALCEDGRTLNFLAPDSQGHWVTASFMLAQPVGDEDFDPTPYEAAFGGGGDISIRGEQFAGPALKKDA